MKLVPYTFPHTRVKLKRDMTDTSVSGKAQTHGHCKMINEFYASDFYDYNLFSTSGNGLGVRVVGGKEIPGSRGEIGTYIAKVIPGGMAEQTGKIVEGKWIMKKNLKASRDQH